MAETVGTMTCTKCFRDTGVKLDLKPRMPVSVVIDLCENWLCDDCLDDAERAAAAIRAEKPEGTEK